jgi:cobalamin biosynthesis protein CbiG
LRDREPEAIRHVSAAASPGVRWAYDHRALLAPALSGDADATAAHAGPGGGLPARGVEPARFEENALDFLKACGVSPLAVRALASIDRKADEGAFIASAKSTACRF